MWSFLLLLVVLLLAFASTIEAFTAPLPFYSIDNLHVDNHQYDIGASNVTFTISVDAVMTSDPSVDSLEDVGRRFILNSNVSYSNMNGSLSSSSDMAPSQPFYRLVIGTEQSNPAAIQAHYVGDVFNCSIGYQTNAEREEFEWVKTFTYDFSCFSLNCVACQSAPNCGLDQETLQCKQAYEVSDQIIPSVKEQLCPIYHTLVMADESIVVSIGEATDEEVYDGVLAVHVHGYRLVDAAYNNKEDYNSLLASTFYVPTVALNGLYLDTPAVDNLINFVTDSEGKVVTFTMPAEKLSAATRFSLGVTIDSPDLTVTQVDANQAYVNLSIHLCNNSINTKKCVDADVFQSTVVQNVTFLTACDAKLNALHSTSTEYCSSCQEIDQCDYVLGENAFYCAHQAATTFPRLEECEIVPTDNNKDIWVYVAVGSSVVVVMVLAYMGYRYKQSQTEAEQDGSLNYDALGA